MNENLPIIGQQKKEDVKILLPGRQKEAPVMLNEHGAEKFARKPKVDLNVMAGMKIKIPYIYYWEKVSSSGVSELMTMAFKIHNGVFGMSYPVDATNVVKIDILRKKLFAVVKESLDVLVHHGTKVLDSRGNIDPRLVNEQEAIRYRYDQNWDKKVAAFNKLVRIAPITKQKAIKLGLLKE